jgi:UDP-glucose 4-epimerase
LRRSSIRTCCVIGGGGFIGGALVPLLVASGRRVVIVDTRDSLVTPSGGDVVYRQGDYGNPHFIRNAIADVEEIVDLAYATVPKTSYIDPVNDIVMNLPKAVGLLQAALERGIRKMVFVSSGGTVYGQAERIPVPEDHPTNPISPYGITKLAVEKYAFMFASTRRLPVVCVRPANAFGEGQRSDGGQGFIAVAIASVLAGEEIPVFGEHGTTRDYIHVSDIASGIVAGLDKGMNGTAYNIGTGEGRTNRQVLEALRKLAGGDGYKVLVHTYPPREYDVQQNVLDSTRLRRDTGWVPGLTFEEGMRRAWTFALQSKRAS